MAKRKDGKDTWEEKRSDPRESSILLQQVLSDWKSPDYWENWPNEETLILKVRGDLETLDSLRSLAESTEAKERSFAALLLDEFGLSVRTYPEECVALLLNLLDQDADEEVLEFACLAARSYMDKRIPPALQLYAAHPSADVRLSVIHGLLPQAPNQSVSILIKRSEDEHEEVRNWAIYGIGQNCSQDTEEIREALRNRLNDEDFVVRFEALAGLASKGDESILERVITDIHQYHDLYVLCEYLKEKQHLYEGELSRLAAALALCQEEEEIGC